MTTEVDKAELIIAVLDRYAVQFRESYSGWQSVRCPNDAGHVHGDANPSARVNLTEGGFNCHGCGMAGDGYSLVMVMEGVDFLNAKKRFDGGVAVQEKDSEWLF